MPDTFQNASTPPQPSALPDNAAHCPDAPWPGCARPSGLPIFSTEKLTHAEIEQLQELATHHREHADLLAALTSNHTVSLALDIASHGAALSQVEAAFSLRLGSNR